MALDPRGAALALHRFGFGPKAGSIAALAPDPLGALLADLDAPNAGQIVNADLPSSGAENRSVYENNAERLAKDKLEKKRKEAAQASADNSGADNAMEQKTMEPKADAAPPTATANTAPPKPVPLARQIFHNEATARFRAAIWACPGFVER
jgi:uncharacterized protein (DUF1800 family)